VVLPAWEQFIQEEELHDIIETITKTSVCRTAYCLKNMVKKNTCTIISLTKSMGTLALLHYPCYQEMSTLGNEDTTSKYITKALNSYSPTNPSLWEVSDLGG
jgi:hypothetical protein